MNKLPPAEQQALRARAHALAPVVMISDKGLSDAVLKEIDLALKAHELIKIRIFSNDRSERAATMTAICARLEALPVQQIGKIIVVFRKNADVPTKTKPTSVKKVPKVAKNIPSSSRRRAVVGAKVPKSRAIDTTRRQKA